MIRHTHQATIKSPNSKDAFQLTPPPDSSAEDEAKKRASLRGSDWEVISVTELGDAESTRNRGTLKMNSSGVCYYEI